MKKASLVCLYCGLALLFACLSACTLLPIPPLPPPISTVQPTPVAPSPTPTVVFSATYFNQAFWRYFHYVEKRQFSSAYEMLSPGLRSREPFADFLKNESYTLTEGGSWKVDKIALSLQDGVTLEYGR